jgi:hypothetical protein
VNIQPAQLNGIVFVLDAACYFRFGSLCSCGGRKSRVPLMQASAGKLAGGFPAALQNARSWATSPSAFRAASPTLKALGNAVRAVGTAVTLLARAFCDI